MNDEQGSLEDIVDEMSIEQLQMAAIRAARVLGLEVYGAVPIIDEDRYEDFEAVFGDQLRIMAVELVGRDAIRDGLVESAGVDDEGHEHSRLTEMGHAYLEEHGEAA